MNVGANWFRGESATRAELLTDNSRDVFEAGRNVAPDGLGSLRELLKDALKLADVI